MPVCEFNPNLNESFSYRIDNGMVHISGMGGLMVAPLNPDVSMKNTPNPHMDRSFILNLYYKLAGLN